MSTSEPFEPHPESVDPSYDRNRVLALSDGVIAIAITLLGLELIPHVARTVTSREIVVNLLEVTPKFVAYVLSFVVIGRFWDYHRAFFRHIHLVDGRVITTNMVVLLWITLIPATAALLGSQWQDPVALTLYAVNLLLTMGSLWLLWRYVSSAGYLRREGIPALADRYINRYVGASFVGFALTIPLAFVSPPAALALVFLTTTLARVVARRILSEGPTSETEPPAQRRG